MAPKRKRVVDDEFSLSQEAEDHDDGQQAVIAQLLKKVQEDRQQAQRKAEKELLKKAKVAFDELVEESQTQWDNTSQQIRGRYERFVTEHAKCNDRIRAHWLAIQKEQERCEGVLERLITLELEEREKSERMMHEALKAQEKAIKEEKHCINLINSVHLQNPRGTSSPLKKV